MWNRLVCYCVLDKCLCIKLHDVISQYRRVGLFYTWEPHTAFHRQFDTYLPNYTAPHMVEESGSYILQLEVKGSPEMLVII
jgi:hypothetical protein